VRHRGQTRSEGALIELIRRRATCVTPRNSDASRQDDWAMATNHLLQLGRTVPADVSYKGPPFATDGGFQDMRSRDNSVGEKGERVCVYHIS
jgi:hypothetical protein